MSIRIQDIGHDLLCASSVEWSGSALTKSSASHNHRVTAHSPTLTCVILGLSSSPNNLVKSGVADDEEVAAIVVVLAVVEVVCWAEVLADSVVVVSSETLEVGWVARAGNGQLRPKGKGRTHIQHIAIAVLRV